MVMHAVPTDRSSANDHNNRIIFGTKAVDHGVLDPYQKHVGDHGSGQRAAKHLIKGAVRKRIDTVNYELCEPGDEDTFFVADLGEVFRQHKRWKETLPRVKPFYAVKCNPDPQLLKLLARLGAGFDCASKVEIELALGLDIDPSRIIYAQPCKTSSYLRFVAGLGVRQMTFDNADELHKIARLYPSAELFLRIHTDDSSSLCRLSLKFGASLDCTNGLLAEARRLGLNVVGVSFHVGSGASDPAVFRKAVHDADVVFEQAAAHGFQLKTLDVGGGFNSDESFEEMAAALRDALDEDFPSHRGVSIIAEPGRFFASSAFTIACHIIARRAIEPQDLKARCRDVPMVDRMDSIMTPPPMPKTSYMVYLNDGLYGNFSSILFDHQHPEPKLLRVAGETLYGTRAADAVADAAASCGSNPRRGAAAAAAAAAASAAIEYSIWGPTCDGIDRVAESVRFSRELNVGDWLYFENMGAYTKCSATTFNGFGNTHDVVYVCSEPGAAAILA